MTDGRWEVGICGTFDVSNYGDLLFPLIAEAELGELEQVHVVVAADVGGKGRALEILLTGEWRDGKTLPVRK